MRTLLLGLLLTSVAIPALAFNPACFCVRKTDGTGIQQYQVMRFATPACDKERYKPKAGTPWDDGIKTCVSRGPASKGPSGDEKTRRCFCSKRLDNGGLQQFRVMGMETPECKGAVYKEDGRQPWDRVLTCDAWTQCYKADSQCQAKIKQYTSNLASDYRNAARWMTAVQDQSNKCSVIENDCWVKGLK